MLLGLGPPVAVLGAAIAFVLVGLLAWLAVRATRSGGLSAGKALRWVALVALAVYVSGLALLGVASVGPHHGFCNDESCGLLAVFLGFALAALGLIIAAIGVALGAVALIRARRWGWLVGLLIPVLVAASVSLTINLGQLIFLGAPFWEVAGAYSLIPLALLFISGAGAVRLSMRFSCGDRGDARRE